MDVTQLALTWVGWPNGEKLALTCVQIWSRPKWAQVNASERKAWPNGVASRPKFSTCEYLRVRFARALRWEECYEKICRCIVISIMEKTNSGSFQLTTRNLNILRCVLYTSQIEASTTPPPRAYPGHLTPFPAREGGNLITTHRGWRIWSLASISCCESRWFHLGW